MCTLPQRITSFPDTTYPPSGHRFDPEGIKSEAESFQTVIEQKSNVLRDEKHSMESNKYHILNILGIRTRDFISSDCFRNIPRRL
ncbi:hypothetical protein CEXT_536931 [Caerostris extrusa]|uniref:Uncharacterized protein n=1 Tax=Caerostris extrusa TaxID=172846 RepID=A0AAV4P7Q0_CAEEX|nr:hypothetical protein CEXT_536931 [Caerostris extrusa]